MSAARYTVGCLLITGLLTGCATQTRNAQLGVLPSGERLVTLVVTEDLAVVRGECPDAVVIGRILGCQTSRAVKAANGGTVRLVKIVRFTDRAPSRLAFEIDLHELCHAVAALQSIPDPCHVGNAGVIDAPSAAPRTLIIR